MEGDDMPEEDIAVLRLSGSQDPHLEMHLLIERVKKEKQIILKRYGEGGFPLTFRETRKRILEKKTSCLLTSGSRTFRLRKECSRAWAGFSGARCSPL